MRSLIENLILNLVSAAMVFAPSVEPALEILWSAILLLSAELGLNTSECVDLVLARESNSRLYLHVVQLTVAPESYLFSFRPSGYILAPNIRLWPDIWKLISTNRISGKSLKMVRNPVHPYCTSLLQDFSEFRRIWNTRLKSRFLKLVNLEFGVKIRLSQFVSIKQ